MPVLADHPFNRMQCYEQARATCRVAFAHPQTCMASHLNRCDQQFRRPRFIPGGTLPADYPYDDPTPGISSTSEPGPAGSDGIGGGFGGGLGGGL